ncbi:MAG: hypothetical protein JWQ64_3408 [Subtercola sp.]|jgi:hypothetical protein|nr:hypothetical protein [Subtercola sp.]
MPEHVLALDDPQAFLGGLVDAATSILPRTVVESALTVVRHRSLADRVAWREGSISSIRLVTRGYIMELICVSGHSYSAETRRVVRGIVVSRRIQNLGEWLEAFAGRVAVLAGRPSAPADALRALGISVSGPQISVGRESVFADLRTLPFKVRGLIPPEASASLGRIVELLLDTLPRVTGDVELNVYAGRTATVYLPETLRAYLALPTAWARGHIYPDGSTPDSALAAQLAVLEQAASRMHEAALRGDANELLINGRFLGYRFGESNLTE